MAKKSSGVIEYPTGKLMLGDCLACVKEMPSDSVNLCFFSPPYEVARTYGIKFDKAGQVWVDWMVEVFQECLRVCRGLVACVCEGMTRSYQWTATPALLMADLHREGVCLRKPAAAGPTG